MDYYFLILLHFLILKRGIFDFWAGTQTTKGQFSSTTTVAGVASVTGGGTSGTGMWPVTNWASSGPCRPYGIAHLDPGEVSTYINLAISQICKH